MIQNIPKEKILEAMQDGPTLPIKISRKVGGDTMIIGAMLSTLISTGDVCISSLKIGGSPLYYLPGQEERLEEFIDHLNDKDQRTFKLLKDKKILQDSAQDPLTRVSLKTLRDFARQIEIDFEGRKEIFWRFYTYDKEEALNEGKRILLSNKASIQIPKEEMVVQEPEESMTKTAYVPVDKIPAEVSETIEAKDIKRHKREHKRHAKPEHISETIEKISDEKQSVVAAPISGTKPSTGEKIEKVQASDEPRPGFYDQIKSHAHKLNLDIISKEKVKKTEYVLILKNHETNEYIYCIAKDKRIVNEGDLSTAFVFSHNKKMPCLFMTTGMLNKKAEQMTQKEFKDMRIEKIE